MKKVCKLSETVDGSERVEWIKSLELHKGCFEHCPDYLLEDDSLFDELEAPEEWFSDAPRLRLCTICASATRRMETGRRR